MKLLLNKIGLWLCRNLGWHGQLESGRFDGASVHARCKRCGYEGMIDSQGNLF